MFRYIILYLNIAFFIQSILSHGYGSGFEKPVGIETIFMGIKGNGKKTLGMYGQFDKCKGHFSRIQWDIIDQNFEWKCDKTWNHKINTTANGYRNNVRYSIDANSEQFIKDTKGNELYNSMGIISTGDCKGGQLIVESDLRVVKGQCKTGVTELYSKKYSALVVIQNVCDTMCNGTIWAHYWPGKH